MQSSEGGSRTAARFPYYRKFFGIFTDVNFHDNLLVAMTLQTPIENVAGVGPTMGERVGKLGIITVEDLFHHFPFRYEDYAQIKAIKDVQPDEQVTILGTIWDISNAYTKFRKIVTKAIVQDGSGTIEIIWFNQPFLTKTIKSGMEFQFSGKVSQNGYKLQLVSPAYEKSEQSGVNTGRLVPIYPETYGVSSRWLRGKISQLAPIVLPQITDWLPQSVQSQYGLLYLPTAIKKIHFPENETDVSTARQRLAFDELVQIHLAALERKHEWQEKSRTKSLTIDKMAIEKFVHSLPFPLTNGQKNAAEEILVDLTKTQAMNRLLEGDVGSGKTVVAAIAVYAAHLNNMQSAIMAPTAILANQHYETLRQFVEPAGLSVRLITSGTKKRDEAGDVTVGTHALLSESVQFQNLGLVVIDEQHKFGVEQRAILSKKGNTPHVLTMTATPIPRTLALTLYGNLDLSVIDEMPPGRSQTKTYVVPNKKRDDAYKFIEKEIREKGIQAFIVCPLIDESETYATTKAAAVEYERLKTDVFPDLRLGLLHGRMKPKEKDKIMEQFRVGELQILVATPLVEVGVDIPNATIMVIEAADRFGLAQLHQLRGRVGRRANQEAYCLLFTELYGKASLSRLKAMEAIYSGPKLAEIDLQHRGAGEMFGIMQHGVPNLKVANLTDSELVVKTKKAAEEIFQNYYTKDSKIRSIIEQLNKKLIAPN